MRYNGAMTSLLRVLLSIALAVGLLFVALRGVVYGREWCDGVLPPLVCKALYGGCVGLIVFVAAYLPMSEIRRAVGRRSGNAKP